MRTSASAVTRGALDSEADVDTKLYARPAQAPSGVQRIVPLAPPPPLVPARVLEVKQQPRARARARALGLNVFLMPRVSTDPPPPWTNVESAPITPAPIVVRKRSRWNYVLAVVAFVIAFVAVASPKTRVAVIDSSRPYARRAWTATRHAAAATATFTVREWHALRARP